MAERQQFFDLCPVCGGAERQPLVGFEELVFVRCGACGLLYKSEEDPALPKRVGRPYDESYFVDGGARYLRRWEHRVAKCRRQLLSCLELAPHARRSLDVGCSAGYVLAAAKQLGLEPVGVDVSRYAVELARTKGFETVVGSITELPFADECFEVVTAKHTLEHARNPKQAIGELRRVLKPGGVLLIVVPDAAYWHLRLSPRGSRYFRPEQLGWQHHVYYSEQTLSRALGDAGLEVLSTDKAVLRRRQSPWWEPVRFGAMRVATTVARVTALRREIQVIARRRT